MAKAFVSYALIKRGMMGHGYKVMGVTTIRGRQYYGRLTEDDSSTHVSERDVVHTFPRQRDAEDAIERLQKVDEAHRPLIAEARANLTQAETNRRIALKAAAVMRSHD